MAPVKHGTIRHPKTKRLKSILKLHHAQIIGHLEALFHFGCENDVGQGVLGFNIQEIAEGCLWEGDPRTFIRALLYSHWLEFSEAKGFFIHDWEDHWTDSIRTAYRGNIRWKRMRAAGGEIQIKLKAFIFSRDKVCLLCGADTDLTVDHIIPISKGGTNRKGNLQALCRSCNSRKGNRRVSRIQRRKCAIIQS